MTDTGYSLDHPAVVASLEAMSYGRKSWEAQRDECYAWLKVKANVDPNMGSNVGERNIRWGKGNANRNTYYIITLQGPWGHKRAYMAAPATLGEALESPLLAKAVRKRDQLRAHLVSEFGEPQSFTCGLTAEIMKVLQTSPEGREYLGRCSRAAKNIQDNFVRVAAAYEYDQWSRCNSRFVHITFSVQPDRVALVQQRWTVKDANALVAQRTAAKRGNHDPFVLPTEKLKRETISEYHKLSARLDKWGILETAQADYYEQSAKKTHKLKAVA